MASTLKINTLTGVTTAGSIAVTGEGNSTTTNLQQGLVKAWSTASQPGTVEDSFNVSSQGDGGTGDFENNLTNNMNSTSGCPTGGCLANDFSAFENVTTSLINQRMISRTDSLAFTDERTYFHLTGDLA